MKKIAVVFAAALLILSCSKNPVIDDETMLDGEKIFDPSLYEPQKYLVSAANPNPSPADLKVPVIIAAHGYSATTFEWDELRAWSKDHGGFLLSQVLLGGHGRTYEEFKRSTWRDWQDPIVAEYEKLERLGYRNISLLGSSTGCALMLELAASGGFVGRTAPRHFFFIDPIVIPSDKLLSLIDFVGPMLGYTEISPTPEEEGKWYHYRPYETLQELNTVINRVRRQLEKGVTLPDGSQMKVYKAIKDPSADPASAVLIYKGVRTSSGGRIAVTMVDTDLHVFTRLAGRENVTERDRLNQQKAFLEIRAAVLGEN